MEVCDGTDFYPTDTKILEQVEPVWDYWPGWASVDNLANLEIFIRRLETALDRPITMVGCGPNREDIIYR
jgi:adenylosuccinate synthase